MTLAQILKLAMRQLDENPEDINEYDGLFTAYANEGYRIAANRFYRPVKSVCAQTDENGILCIDPQKVIKVIQLDRVTDDPLIQLSRVNFTIAPDGKTIYTGVRNQQLMATCQVRCPDLVEDSDEPMLPEENQFILVDYICYRQLSNGNPTKQRKAQDYLVKFQRGCQNIKGQSEGNVYRQFNLYRTTGIGGSL